MAVGPRPTENKSLYDPNQDFTHDQLQRYGNVANRAHKQRIQRAREKKYAALFLESAKEKALKPDLTNNVKKDHSSLRYAVGLVVTLLFLLWLMYMTA